MRTKLQTYLVLSIPVSLILVYLYIYSLDTLSRVSDLLTLG